MSMSDTSIPVPGAKQAHVQVNGPSSYTTGGFDVTITNINFITRVLNVSTVGSGYIAVLRSISGNTAKLVVYNSLPAHGHDLTTVAAAGGGNALTEPAVPGPIETAGAGQTNPGAIDACLPGNATEVAATTNLSAVVFSIDAEGF